MTHDAHAQPPTRFPGSPPKTGAHLRDAPEATMPGACEAQGWPGRVLLVGLLALGLEAVARTIAGDAERRQAAQPGRTVMVYSCEHRSAANPPPAEGFPERRSPRPGRLPQPELG